MTELLKTGLVLSGGGAKGAYHVGVVRALAEYGIEADIISGASIGALNGSLLAASGNMKTGYERLNTVWQQLSQQSPIEVDTKSIFVPQYLVLLASFGLRFNITNIVPYMAYRTVKGIMSNYGLMPNFLETVTKKFEGKKSLLNNAPLTNIITEYLDFEALQKGTRLYVSAYKSNGGLLDLAGCIGAMLDIKNTAPSDFFCIQDLPESERQNALMASAALPLLFESQKIGSSQYTDGGQGGWKSVQGNTPITPLINEGCNLIFVSHLSDGSMWDRHDFPDTTVIEIRPQSNIKRDGFTDLVGFDAKRIPEWIEQGYTDTIACLSKIKESLVNRSNLHEAMNSQKIAEAEMLESSNKLSEAMAKLRSKK